MVTNNKAKYVETLFNGINDYELYNYKNYNITYNYNNENEWLFEDSWYSSLDDVIDSIDRMESNKAKMNRLCTDYCKNDILINESHEEYMSTPTTNPTWQLINNLCKDVGYYFDPYARVILDNNGEKHLEDINIFTSDPSLPKLDVIVDSKIIDFEIYFKQGTDIMSLEEYSNYVDRLSSILKLLSELKTINLWDLYLDVGSN